MVIFLQQCLGCLVLAAISAEDKAHLGTLGSRLDLDCNPDCLNEQVFTLFQ